MGVVYVKTRGDVRPAARSTGADVRVAGLGAAAMGAALRCTACTGAGTCETSVGGRSVGAGSIWFDSGSMPES